MEKTQRSLSEARKMTVNCPHCNTEFDAKYFVCPSCGTVLEEPKEEKILPSTPKENVEVCSCCGRVLRADSSFCSYCGTVVPPKEVVPETEPRDGSSEICPVCEKIVLEGAAFCSHCGTVIPKKTVVSGEKTQKDCLEACSVCGKPMPEGAAFCSYCGSSHVKGSPEIKTAPPETVRFRLCPSCGRETPENSRFCTYCGKDRFANPSEKKTLSKRRISPLVIVLISVGAVILSSLLALIFMKTFSSNSLEGVWVNGDDRIVFTENGDVAFSYVYNYAGTYTVDDGKTLLIDYPGFVTDYSCEYQYGKQAKSDEDYWYRDGNTLYIGGVRYTKTNPTLNRKMYGMWVNEEDEDYFVEIKRNGEVLAADGAQQGEGLTGDGTLDKDYANVFEYIAVSDTEIMIFQKKTPMEETYNIPYILEYNDGELEMYNTCEPMYRYADVFEKY